MEGAAHTKGLDAAGAQTRVAWPLGGMGIDPNPKLTEVKAATLEVGKDRAKLVAYYGAPGPGMKTPRVIITTPAGSKIYVDVL